MPPPTRCDILVAGSGNAGFSAAVAAKEAGAKHVLLIDKCPEDWAGGNSYFTAGAYRTVHGGISDLLPIVNNVDDETAKKIDLDPYTNEDFSKDMKRICSGRSDPRLSKILIEESNSAVKWLKGNGIRFQLSFNRQAYEVDGRLKFWGGLHIKTEDGGKGLIEDHKAAAKKHGVEVLYSTALKRLIPDPKTGAVTSVEVQSGDEKVVIETGAVILAAGGFESNPRLRSQYLGPGWDLAKVRGTPHNMGDVLETAIRDVSAAQAGNWSGCHSVAWDANAPSDTGDRVASNEFTKSGYPLGLMLNILGERFVDEGIDLRNYTYAKFGRAILAQPSHVAFQVWDSRMISWLRAEEYREERVERISADSIEELAEKLSTSHGLENKDEFIHTVKEYNEAVYAFQEEQPERKWDPAVRDGLSTQSSSKRLALGKTNWALPVDKAPFLAVAVTCGITFTFGGLKVNPETTQVVSSATGREVPGVYAVGEMLGGLFYENYPGGSGLTSGAVFGRRAGTAAATAVLSS
ncbi:hypothetical protein H2200_003901 [Cladophialophora chaetospira]|uniref:FAD-dependent oxidoreductase 2 FAD-binding domain-containing protein n=1 Tax=Cladophialophora chaetospira TaxID=386627 RepID=A0AA39CKE1_9EURO|nr:hypothetical protein H2200_003901 [Cladophialophora chaetospira]